MKEMRKIPAEEILHDVELVSLIRTSKSTTSFFFSYSEFLHKYFVVLKVTEY